MKTFDENEIITWANRDKAEIGKKYYFADDIRKFALEIRAENERELGGIRDNFISSPFFYYTPYLITYAALLPVDKVYEIEICNRNDSKIIIAKSDDN